MTSALHDVLHRDTLQDGSLNPALARPGSGPARLCFTIDSFLFCDVNGVLCPLDVCDGTTVLLGLGNALSVAVRETTERVAFKVDAWEAIPVTALDQATLNVAPGITTVVHAVAADYWLLEPHPLYRALHAAFQRKLLLAHAVVQALTHGATTYPAVLEQIPAKEEELVTAADFVLEYAAKHAATSLGGSGFQLELLGRRDSAAKAYVVPEDTKHKRNSCHICKLVPRHAQTTPQSSIDKIFYKEHVGKCSRCSRHFCADCLLRMFGESLKVMKSEGLTCPVCREICYCSACRKSSADAAPLPAVVALEAKGYSMGLSQKEKKRKRVEKEKGKEEKGSDGEEHKHHRHHHKHHHHHHHHDGEGSATDGDDSKKKKKDKKDKPATKKQKTLEEFVLPRETTERLRAEIQALTPEQRAARLDAEKDPQTKTVISGLIENIKRVDQTAFAREEKKHEKLRYPIDDADLEEFEEKKAKRHGQQRPPWPAGNKLVAPSGVNVGEVILAWQFLSSFRAAFSNAKVSSMHDVVKMIACNSAEACDLAETLHADMLQAILSQEEASKAREEDRNSEEPEVDALSCWDFLRARLEQSRSDTHKALARGLAEHDFFELGMPEKAAILSFLCDELMKLGQFRGTVEEGLHELADARAALHDFRVKHKIVQLDRQETPQPENPIAQRRRELKEQREDKARQQQEARLETKEQRAAAAVRVELLGIDRHNRNYWLYGGKAVLVFDQTTDQWFLYLTKERLDELRNWLTVKGVHEGAIIKELDDMAVRLEHGIEEIRDEFAFDGGVSDQIDLFHDIAVPVVEGSASTEGSNSTYVPATKDRIAPIAAMLSSLASSMPEKALKDKSFVTEKRSAFYERAASASTVSELAAIALELEALTDAETLDDPGWKDRTEAWQERVRNAKTPAALAVAVLAYDTVCPWSPRCRVCKRRLLDQRYVQCTHCGRCFHLGCLRPPLHRVPTADWFCSSCKSVEQELLSKSNETCEICKRGGQMLCCESCPRVFHLSCLNMFRLPKGAWHCKHCRKDQEDGEEDVDEDMVAAAAAALPARSAKTRGRELVRRMVEDDNNDSMYLGEQPPAKKTARAEDKDDDEDEEEVEMGEPANASHEEEYEPNDDDDDDEEEEDSDAKSSSESSSSDQDSEEDDDETFRSKAEQARHNRAKQRRKTAKRRSTPAPNVSRMGLRSHAKRQQTSDDDDDDEALAAVAVAEAEEARRAGLGLRSRPRRALY